AALRESARRAVPHNRARDAAAHIVSLVLPELDVARAKDALHDSVLAHGAQLEVALVDVVDLAGAVCGRAGHHELASALHLLERAAAASVPRAVLVKVAHALAKKARSRGPHDGALDGSLVDALSAWLSSSSLAGQWSALPILLQALPAERTWPLPILARELLAFLERAHDDGVDVFAAARLLHDSNIALGDPPSSQPVLALALRRLHERAAS
ncbi:MAG TPA: hypothetical protein VGO62_11850, partial [Myxococcota bacterium]